MYLQFSSSYRCLALTICRLDWHIEFLLTFLSFFIMALKLFPAGHSIRRPGDPLDWLQPVNSASKFRRNMHFCYSYRYLRCGCISYALLIASCMAVATAVLSKYVRSPEVLLVLQPGMRE